MPIKTQRDLPAKAILEHENIFVMDEERAIHQDIRVIEIGILNLMPLKEETELQLLRSLSNSPLQVHVTFITVESHSSKNTSANHLNQFYQTFSEVRNRNFDGMIITGAPVEMMDFEEVDYWDELAEIMEWTKSHVTCTFHVCWGAQAGLYYHYGVAKEILPAKKFGIFSHQVRNRKIPLVRGFDDVFMAPHSRHTRVDEDAVRANKDLVVLADSDEAGIFLVMSTDNRQIFCLGHPEYDRLTLDKEYRRDLDKGVDIQLPVNYYPDDDINQKPLLQWRSHANCLYTNFLDYYVYQATPYDLDWLPADKR